MKEIYSDRLRGVLLLLVLQTLASRGRLHGYGITSHIRVVSKELIRIEEGSLYPALHRMEHEGLLEADWGVTEKNRKARFYTITKKGRTRLAREEASWFRLTDGVRHVFRYA